MRKNLTAKSNIKNVRNKIYLNNNYNRYNFSCFSCDHSDITNLSRNHNHVHHGRE